LRRKGLTLSMDFRVSPGSRKPSELTEATIRRPRNAGNATRAAGSAHKAMPIAREGAGLTRVELEKAEG
jgi:hypothetical protein